MTRVSPNRRLGAVALLFVVALGFVGVAAATHDVWPLFIAWIPLLTVPWVLTRPE